MRKQIVLVSLVLIQVFARVTARQTFASGSCGDQAVDMVFAIDTSSSIWKPDFERQIEFIKNVSEQFDLGNSPKQTRIGVVSFADTYYPQFHLWKNNRPDLLKRALLRIRHKVGRKTNTGAALHYMRKYMFSHRYGCRKYSTHVAIVITDGRSQNRQKTLVAAEKAKQEGIKIFAIGVGKEVDTRELEGMASQPTDDYMFKVNDFKSLDSMKFILANKSCSTYRQNLITRPPPPILTTPKTTATPILYPPSVLKNHDRLLQEWAGADRKPIVVQSQSDSTQSDIDPRLNVTNCGGKPADIYFALDASNSIWPEDFKKQLTFVKDLISLFDISNKKTRVGLVTFSDTVTSIFDLNTRQNKEHLHKLISNVTFMSGRTKTSEAISFVREQGFSRDVARQEVAHIILLFTDGLSKNPRDTAREAELAKRQGIYIFSVGIGASVETTELQDIASDPEDDFVFRVNNFTVLNKIKDILAIKTCAVQPKNFVADAAELACNINNPTDMMFVYDSAQLGIGKTRKITKFVYDITSALSTDSGLLKVGRLMENCLTGADTYLTSQKAALDFDGIYFPDYRRLIRKLASMGFSESYGARRYARKVAVLFLDDTMENLKQASDEIARLHDTHTLVVTIGNSDLHTAAKFATKPTSDYLVNIPSYKYLQTAKYTLLQKLCKIFNS